MFQMCKTSTENRDKYVEPYYIYSDQVTVLNVPDIWNDLPVLGDFPPDNPQHIGFLVIIDGEEILIFTNDDGFSLWQAEDSVKAQFLFLSGYSLVTWLL